MTRELLIISNTFPPSLGGAEKQTEILAKDLSNRGWKVNVIFRTPSGDVKRPDSDRLNYYPVDISAEGIWGALEFSVKAFLTAVKIQDGDANILAIQISSTALIGCVLKLLFGKKLVVRIATSGKRGDIRLSKDYILGRIKLRLVLKYTDKMVALNEETKGELLNCDFPGDRIHLVPNSVDTDKFNPRSRSEKRKLRDKLDLPPGFIFIYTGRLHPGKGVLKLVDVWEVIAPEDGALVILGAGELEEQLSVQLKDCNSNVVFPGYIRETAEYLSASDAFVLYSEAEGISNALLEAMASGLACICTDIAGNNEVVEDMENGILVPPGEDSALKAKMSLCMKNRDLVKRLGENAREYVKKHHSREQMIDNWEDVLESL